MTDIVTTTHLPFRVGPLWGETGVEILCPECDPADGFSHVHFQTPVHHVTDGYTCPTGERGDWIDIPAWCEEGDHHFHLVVAFHKGSTRAHMVRGDIEFPVTSPLQPIRRPQ